MKRWQTLVQCIMQNLVTEKQEWQFQMSISWEWMLIEELLRAWNFCLSCKYCHWGNGIFEESVCFWVLNTMLALKYPGLIPSIVASPTPAKPNGRNVCIICNNVAPDLAISSSRFCAWIRSMRFAERLLVFEYTHRLHKILARTCNVSPVRSWNDDHEDSVAEAFLGFLDCCVWISNIFIINIFRGLLIAFIRDSLTERSKWSSW